MKKIISDFLFYNRRQKIGVVVFCLLTLINVVIILIDPFPKIKSTDFSLLIREMDSLDNVLSGEITDSVDHRNISPDKPANLVQRFTFDPNTVTEQELYSLGFQKALARRIINFRDKGGKFRRAEDLKKIYGVEETFYESLADYIVISSTQEKQENNFTGSSKKQIEQVEINTADSVGLCSIKGIGQTFARRIMKYREKLGGFLYKEQLLEVYGMDSVKFEAIRAWVSVDQEKIRRIPVNLVSEAELAKHPYIGYRLSKRIVAYRNQHGKFISVDDLLKIETISAADIEKIKPYIITD